jgi:hypothetical protein
MHINYAKTLIYLNFFFILFYNGGLEFYVRTKSFPRMCCAYAPRMVWSKAWAISAQVEQTFETDIFKFYFYSMKKAFLIYNVI